MVRLKFRAVSEEEGQRIIEEAGKLNEQTRPKGHSNGVVTQNGLMILKGLIPLYLDPASEYFDLSPSLEKATCLSRTSLYRGLRALKETGFLARITDDTAMN